MPQWTNEQLLALVASVIEGGPTRTMVTGLLGIGLTPWHEDVRRLAAGEQRDPSKIERLKVLSNLFGQASAAIDLYILAQEQKNESDKRHH